MIMRVQEMALTCADGVPSARILDCARTKKLSVHNRGSWIKANPDRLGFIQNRVFCADVLFIRAEDTVGAQSAQCLLSAHSRIEVPRLDLR